MSPLKNCKKKIGLALSGGAARGLAHIGEEVTLNAAWGDVPSTIMTAHILTREG